MAGGRRQEEFRLQCVVADYLRVALPDDCLWSHLPFGEQRSAVTGARLKRMGTNPGWPDFIILLPGGRTLFLELKAPGGALNPNQRLFHVKSARLGHAVHICKSLDDVEKALAIAGVELKARAA